MKRHVTKRVPAPHRSLAPRSETASIRAEIQKAARLAKNYSGHSVRVFGKVKVAEVPKVAIAIGPLLGVIYQAKRDGKVENYIHHFVAKNTRPLLCVTPDGKRLLLIGGSYSFTERGIVDIRVKQE